MCTALFFLLHQNSSSRMTFSCSLWSQRCFGILLMVVFSLSDGGFWHFWLFNDLLHFKCCKRKPLNIFICFYRYHIELWALWLIHPPCVFLYRLSAELMFINLKYLCGRRKTRGKRGMKVCVTPSWFVSLGENKGQCWQQFSVIFSFPKWKPNRKKHNCSAACLKGLTWKRAHRTASHNDVFWTEGDSTNNTAIVAALSPFQQPARASGEVLLQGFLYKHHPQHPQSVMEVAHSFP